MEDESSLGSGCREKGECRVARRETAFPDALGLGRATRHRLVGPPLEDLHERGELAVAAAVVDPNIVRVPVVDRKCVEVAVIIEITKCDAVGGEKSPDRLAAVRTALGALVPKPAKRPDRRRILGGDDP